MLERSRRFLGYSIARFRLRSQRDKVLSFPHALASAGRVLLVLPEKPWEFTEAATVLRPLLGRFTASHITIVSFPAQDSPGRLVPRSHVLSVTADDLTLFYLPRQKIIDAIRREKFDLAVDLNLDFMLASAYICKVSDAKVRVGSARRNADLFFNFQVRVDPVSPPGQSYKRFVRCLQMFLSAEEV